MFQLKYLVKTIRWRIVGQCMLRTCSVLSNYTHVLRTHTHIPCVCSNRRNSAGSKSDNPWQPRKQCRWSPTVSHAASSHAAAVAARAHRCRLLLISIIFQYRTAFVSSACGSGARARLYCHGERPHTEACGIYANQHNTIGTHANRQTHSRAHTSAYTPFNSICHQHYLFTR